MPKVVVVDDDLAMDLICERLRHCGCEVNRIPSAEEALASIDALCAADVVVLDIIMKWPENRVGTGLSGAANAGMEIMLEIRRRSKLTPVIAYSATQDLALIDALTATPNSCYIWKWESHSYRALLEKVGQILGIEANGNALQSFIVHGHAEAEKWALKNYLQNTLHLPEPTILHEKPSLGRTIIDKFEDYAGNVDIVFVLITPDDKLADHSGSDDEKRRARQNVIFEMGYFLGSLGRRSGRVMLLHKGPIELPSDIQGVVYIDISAGIEAAGEQIRREVAHVRYV